MADVNITLTIPDAHVTRVSEAFTKLSGANIHLDADKDFGGTMFTGRWDFMIDPQEGAETTKEFAIRFITDLIKATVKLVDYAEDRERYNTEVAAITKPDEDVPDGIVTGS